MRYLATVGVFLVFGAILIAADFYEQNKRDAEVADWDSYQATISDRLSWITGSDEMRPAGATDTSGILAALSGSRGRDQSDRGANAKSSPVKQHLPDAPEGWSRRNFEHDDARILKGFAGEQVVRLGMAQFLGTNIIRTTMSSNKSNAERLLRPSTWMYEQGGNLVQLTAMREVRFDSDEMQSGMMDLGAAEGEYIDYHRLEFFAVVGGVVWTRREYGFGGPPPSNAPKSIDLEARLGDIHLYARGTTDAETLLRFIEAIDYDGLNEELVRPFDNVGSNAPAYSEAEEQTLFEQEVERRRKARQAQFEQGRENMTRGLSDTYKSLNKILGKSSDPRGTGDKYFEAMGLPNREAAGDLSVMSPEEIRAKVLTLSDADARVFGSYLAKTMLHLGTSPEGTTIRYDGNTADAARLAATYAAGDLAEGHPAQAVRRAEVEGGYPPGACLELVSGDLACGTHAERLRFVWDIRDAREERRQQERNERRAERSHDGSHLVPDVDIRTVQSGPRQQLPAAAPASNSKSKPTQVKINRHSGGRVGGSSGSCGGTSFCRVSGD